MSGPADSTDFTVIPVEISVDFTIAFEQGHGHPLGAMQDFAGHYKQTKFEMKPCEFIANPNKKDAASASDDDDDDFDEDEDEDGDGDDEKAGGASSDKKNQKLKVYQLSQLVCSLKHKANEVLSPGSAFDTAFHFKIQDFFNPTKNNTWYNLQVAEPVFQFLCQGFHLTAPAPAFKSDGRFSLQYNVSR